MKLHALYIEFAVPGAHDETVAGGGSDFENVGRGGGFDDEGVVAGGFEWAGYAGEHPPTFVVD